MTGGNTVTKTYPYQDENEPIRTEPGLVEAMAEFQKSLHASLQILGELIGPQVQDEKAQNDGPEYGFDVLRREIAEARELASRVYHQLQRINERF
jgi:hypothetical protein